MIQLGYTKFNNTNVDSRLDIFMGLEHDEGHFFVRSCSRDIPVNTQRNQEQDRRLPSMQRQKALLVVRLSHNYYNKRPPWREMQEVSSYASC